MFRKIIFYDNFTNALSGTWPMFLLQGVSLVLLGIIIIMVPEFLVAMIAATFILIGVIFLTLAWKTYRFKRHYQLWRDEFWEPFD